MKRVIIEINIDISLRFWALLPALNLNFCGGFTLEFEWLCLGVYIKKKSHKIKQGFWKYEDAI